MAQTPSAIAFERRYGDDSGVEFGVRYDENGDSGRAVNLYCQGASIDIPADELRWFAMHLIEVGQVLGLLTTPTQEARDVE